MISWECSRIPCARTKRRAVEPEQLEKQGSVWNAFAPALVSEFSTRDESDVSLDLMGMLSLRTYMDFMQH